MLIIVVVSCEGLVVRGGDGDNFYVAGTYTINYSMKNTALITSLGGRDVFVAKVANGGNVLWLFYSFRGREFRESAMDRG